MRQVRVRNRISNVLASKGPVTFYTDRTSCEASATALVMEDFDAATLPAAPNNVAGTETPLSSFTSDATYSPGDIEAGLVVGAAGATISLDGEVVVLGGGFAGIPSTSTGVGANFFADNTRLDFRPGASTVCFDYISFTGDGAPVDIAVYGTDGSLLGMQNRTSSASFAHGGVSSATPIGHIVIFDAASDGTFVDDVSFELTGPAPGDAPTEPEIFAYMGSGTTAGGPTFARSDSDFFTGECIVSTSATAVNYDTFSFTPESSGLHIINASFPEHDGYLAVYEGTFDPSDACANLVAQDDDGPTGTDSAQAFAFLVGGSEYVVVSSAFSNGNSGSYSLDIFGGRTSDGGGGGGGGNTVDEDGDAPDALSGTQDATGDVDQINGLIEPGDIADCYAISIADIDAFSATTANTMESPLLDSQLQLFTSGLDAVVFNDDTVADPAPSNFLSTIPAGTLSGLGYDPGDFVICVTEWDVDAQNAAGENIFAGNGREIRFPTAPNGDNVLAQWFESNAVNGGRGYQLDLTGLGEVVVPTTPIADVRAAGTGVESTFSGVVTRAMGAFTYLQDGTAGITIRQTSGDFFDDVADGTIAAGTQLTVTGTTSQFRGLFQVNEGGLASYSVDGTTGVPAPQVIDLAELLANGESYEAELVQVTDLTTAETGVFSAATTYAVDDGTGSGDILRVPNADDSAIDGTDIPGGAFTFTGVVGQFTFADPATDGYQLLAIADGDVMEQPDTGDTVEEDGDAPLALDGTQDATGSVGQITGMIDPDVDLADCYAITIADIDAFSATTENSPPNDAGQNLDTQLQLFTSGLEGVVFQDDTPDDPDLFSTIPAGALSDRGLSPGDYVLCVTEWDVDAKNAAGEDIFLETAPFDSVVYPSAPSGDNVLAQWDPETNTIVGGRPYQIDLTGTGGATGASCEDLTIALSPVTDYVVPSEGGMVRMVMEIVNDSDQDCSFEAWGFSMDPLLTNGVFIRPGRAVTVPANSTLRQGYNQRAPADIADGDYMYSVNIGQYDDADPTSSEIYDGDDVVITKGLPTLGYNEFSYGYLKRTYGHDYAAFKAAYEAARPYTPTLKSKDWGGVEHGEPQIRPNGPIMAEVPTAEYVEAVGTTVGPNPFRGSTTFTYDVEVESDVSLVVYDVLGRVVATPVEGRQQAGRHTAEFSGRGLQAGTYVYRLEVGDRVETGRVTLAR